MLSLRLRARALNWAPAAVAFWLLASFAGIPEAPAAETRPFAFVKRDGIHWAADPEGRTFFTLGVCVVDQGLTRDRYDPARPAYAAWRRYPSPREWADATLGRLREWGFTTVGGWGDYASLLLSRRMDLFMTPVLAAGMEAGAPWFDLWDPALAARIEEIARGRIQSLRDHPRLFGYYTDNELGWWNGALFKMTFEHPATSGQRRRLVEIVREKYRGDWAVLLRDFEPVGAGSFDELERKGVLYLRPGGMGIRVARRFLEVVADRYYEVLGGIVRRHDTRGLNLGDRYQSFYYPEVARACRRYVDAVSTNLNAQWSDGTFARFYLETLHKLTEKPILVSEFYMSATENKSGNPNDRGLYPVVPTQAERAAGFRRTLTALLDLPYVVGADWFQYYDEPPGGRFDGENFNFGLVDIEDRPYEDLIAAARGLDAAALHRGAGRRRADASGGVPPAPLDPLGGFEPNLALGRWDRERGFVRPVSESPLADLYIAWSPDALCLGIVSLDPVEGTYYRDERVPEADRMEWVVKLDGLSEPVRLRLGAGQPATGAPQGATVVCLSGPGLGVRVVAALRLSTRIWGREKLAAGDRLRLSSTLTSHARAYQTEWAGELELAR